MTTEDSTVTTNDDLAAQLVTAGAEAIQSQIGRRDMTAQAVSKHYARATVVAALRVLDYAGYVPHETTMLLALDDLADRIERGDDT